MKIKLRSAYQEMAPAVRTSIWFTLCNFLQRGTALITVPIFTRLLTTDEYGICNIYFAWFDVFLMFTSLKMPYEGLNNGLIRYEKDKDGYTSSVMGLIMVMTLITVAVYAVFHSWIDRVTGLSSFIMLLMFIQLFFNPPLMLWTNRERFDFRYRRPAAVTMISTLLNPLIAVIAVLSTDYKAEARIISFVSVQTFFGLILGWVLLFKGKALFNKKYWRFALRFNLPLIFYYISQSVLNYSDRIMINYFEGSGKAAIYSVAYSAATIMLLLVSAINGSFNPWMYKKLKTGRFQDIRKMTNVLCLLIAAATLFMGIFAPDLVRIMATEAYGEAVWIIPPAAASVFFVFMYMVFANVEMYFGRNTGILVISIICSAANLILNAICIPVWGYMAAGWTTLICYMLLTLLHYLLMKRACRWHQVQENIFSEKILLLIALGVLILSLAMLGMYRLHYFRYMVLVLEAVVLFGFRRKLLRALKQSRKGEEKNGE